MTTSAAPRTSTIRSARGGRWTSLVGAVAVVVLAVDVAYVLHAPLDGWAVAGALLDVLLAATVTITLATRRLDLGRALLVLGIAVGTLPQHAGWPRPTSKTVTLASMALVIASLALMARDSVRG